MGERILEKISEVKTVTLPITHNGFGETRESGKNYPYLLSICAVNKNKIQVNDRHRIDNFK